MDYLSAVEHRACFLEDLSNLTLTQFVSCASTAFLNSLWYEDFFLDGFFKLFSYVHAIKRSSSYLHIYKNTDSLTS